MNELNFNKLPDTSTTGITTAVSSSKYCKYRLPCGFCELRKTQCSTQTYAYYNSDPILNPCTISDVTKTEVVPT